MFRLAQQSQVIKGRLPNQFAHASARNSFNHSIRFNSAVALERQDSGNAPLPHGSGAGSGNSSTKHANEAVNKVRHLRKQLGSQAPFSHYNNNRHLGQTTPVDSPWYNKVCAFEECVAQTLNMSQTPRRRSMRQSTDHPSSNANPLFWDSIARAMDLYHDLIETPELNSDRVSRLVHLLHNGLRANRNQLTRMNKKPDYDSQSFHKEMTNYLCKSLREVADNMLTNKVELNEYGAMHLITAFKELLLFEEAVSIWKAAINGTNSYSANIFLNPRVVGVILPILYDHGVPYPEIQALYEKSSSMINYFHPNLSVGMIRASLSAGENEMALNLFQKLCEESTEMKYGYLIETHLSFIGECTDLNVAQTFFEKALNDEMPYKIDLQVSYVKSFLRNVWTQTHDLQLVYDIWYKSSMHYGRDVNHGISSSLNDTFFDIFFQNYANNKVDGFQALQNLIYTYNEIKKIDEPFFNIILAKCSVWRDRKIIEYLDKSYELFHIPKTIVAYRILLKSMGSVDDATNVEIMQRWIDLVNKSDETGQKFIANADWAALRDATVTWTQCMRDLLENSASSDYQSVHSSTSFQSGEANKQLFAEIGGEVDYSHPALQAANASGAFDDVSPLEAEQQQQQQQQQQLNQELDQRMRLYLKIVKRYSPYCRDPRQLTRLTSGTAVKYSVLEEALPEFANLDVSDIPVPEFHNIRSSSI
ncbi:YBR238C and RMD9 (YGL107C) [Zygosaccharomyces parabailii]|nr:YBR238C and RMD9 (YGL107C) [Zygosaccharomyces parabailii]